MKELFNHTFTPWFTDGNSRERAGESDWKSPAEWEREANTIQRPRILIDTEVFEEWDGPIVDKIGWAILKAYLDRERHIRDSCPIEQLGKDMQGWQPITMDDCRRDLFNLIDTCPTLDWIIKTKHPENVRRMWQNDKLPWRATGEYHRDNVWIGASVSDQSTADRQIPELLKLRDLTPCLFLSVEPLLEAVDIHHSVCGAESMTMTEPMVGNLDWVIIAGDSNPSARPCNIEWIRNIVRQCKEAGVPCFVKQLGSNVVDVKYSFPPTMHSGGGKSAGVILRHSKGANPNEWPEDIRVQEIPTCH